ncbi:MAG: DUF3261 domain-containing protein [Gammaproteobacteria bacterium]|nr:DUF3261 domain-containing protein [Gammaproteobacteria bacterium]
MNGAGKTLGLFMAASWLCLSSCSTTQTTAITPDAINWAALASRWTGPEDYRVEIVTFHDLKKSESYHARFDIELTHHGLTLIAQTPLGVLLYELHVSDGEMTIKRHVDQLRGLPVEQTLADFVLTYWPLEQLMEAAAAVGYSIHQADTIRSLRNSEDEILVDVIRDKGAGVIKVVHHDIPLRIDIRHTSGRQIQQ